MLFESKGLTEMGVLWPTAAANKIHVHACQPKQWSVLEDRGSLGLLMKGHHSGLAPDCGNYISRPNRSVSAMQAADQTYHFIADLCNSLALFLWPGTAQG